MDVGVAENVCLTFTFPSRIHFIPGLLIAVFTDGTRKQVEKGVHVITNLNEKYMATEISKAGRVRSLGSPIICAP